MATTSAICSLSAAEMARLIVRRELSAVEAVTAHLEQIDRVNPTVNAIVTLTPERALEQARVADESMARSGEGGLLAGLPIAHKDLQWTAGVRTTFGSPVFRDFVPSQDSVLVARLRRAGAIAVGKTNTPEFGAGSQTFNPVFGATLNPYDRSKTCGGSSGGAAVALACRMVPIADGTDMGGSLRNPAAFCGVVGIRPTVDRIDTRSEVESWTGLSVDGPMARSASDAALLLAAIVGEPMPSMGRDFQGVQIAWATDLPGVPFDPRIRRAVDAHRATFESIGCAVTGDRPDLDGADDAFKILRAKAFVDRFGDLVRQHRPLIKDTILGEIDRGEKLTPADVARGEQLRAMVRERFARFMQRREFFVLPTTQVPPFDVQQPFVTEIDGVAQESYIDWMRSCYYISVLGVPAASVPCGVTPDGLPVGLQIVGRAGADWDVLRLAHAFELARGPFAPPHL